MDDKASMAAEREQAKKHKTFNEIEKRKVGLLLSSLSRRGFFKNILCQLCNVPCM
jgi:hypothetical protein